MSVDLSIKNRWNIRLSEIFALLLGFFLSQAIVFVFHQNQMKMAKFSVQAFLNKNEFTSNPYKTSQALESLEVVGLIACSSLKLEGEAVSFFKNSCPKTNRIFYSDFEMRLASASGQVWVVVAQVGENRAISILLIAFQILFAISGFMLMRLHIRKLEKIAIENKANEQLVNLSRQVAHDIRSPLSALRVISSNNQSIPVETQEIINEVVLRVNGIADDLLEHSRAKFMPIKFGSGIQQNNKFEVVNSIKKIVAEKKAQFPTFDFQFESKLNSVEIKFDKKMFERILSNLLNNSIEASTDNQSIGIQLFESGEFATLLIIDYGAGMSEEILEKIGQEKVSTKEAKGNGIGLYSAIKAIKEAGGDLNILSKVGVGTQVVVRFKT